ncbi:MAG: hypothetical protein R3Y11_08770 [Pseudomonadota bacterium]
MAFSFALDRIISSIQARLPQCIGLTTGQLQYIAASAQNPHYPANLQCA